MPMDSFTSASRTPLADGWTRNYNLWPSQREHISRTHLSFLNYFKLQEHGTLSPCARLFTFDAVSMYTDIPTDYALEIISKYLRNNEYRFNYHAETFISALEIVMKINIIKFGDVYKKQNSGTTMGKPPAPPWVTIYEGRHKDEYLPQWTTYVKFIRRFIDDGNAIWDPPAEVSDEEPNIKYNEFKAVHRTEIIGSGLCAESPHHFFSRLFSPRLDVPLPTDIPTQFLTAKNRHPHHFRSKIIPLDKRPHQKNKKIAPITPPDTIPHQSPSYSLFYPNNFSSRSKSQSRH